MRTGEPFNPHRLFVGSFIPNCIMQFPGLSPIAKLTWSRLQQFADKNGDCYPSYAKLARELAISRRHAMRSIQELIDKGFLKVVVPTSAERGRKITNRYIFLWHGCFEGAKLRNTGDESVTSISTTSDESVTGVATDMSLGTGDESVRKLVTDSSPKDITLRPQEKDDYDKTANSGYPDRGNGSSVLSSFKGEVCFEKTVSVQNLEDMLPEKHRNDAKAIRLIQDSFTEYSGPYLKAQILYVAKMNPGNFMAYLRRAISANYAEYEENIRTKKPDRAEISAEHKPHLEEVEHQMMPVAEDEYLEVRAMLRDWNKKHGLSGREATR